MMILKTKRIILQRFVRARHSQVSSDTIHKNARDVLQACAGGLLHLGGDLRSRTHKCVLKKTGWSNRRGRKRFRMRCIQTMFRNRHKSVLPFMGQKMKATGWIIANKVGR